MPPKPPITPEQLATCLEVIEAARALDPAHPTYLALERAAAHLVKSARIKRRRERRRLKRQRELELLAQTGRVQADAHPAPPRAEVAAGNLGQLDNDRSCYICKARYRQVDAHYHLLCPPCAQLNRARRLQGADLRGRRALVTGGRVKIGFQLALKLLRDGAHVTITTRFAADAARRYAAQPDADSWRARLVIVGLDLRAIADVIAFTDRLASGPALDLVINNAAQTIRRPPAWYRKLAEAELDPLEEGARAWIEADSAALTRRKGDTPTPHALEAFQALARGANDPLHFPDGLDEEGKALDLRPVNSWVLELDQIEAAEMAEAFVINAMAPFLINSRLLPSMRRSPFADRYIVNVSAVEGQFGYASKTSRHPHTNMAKAALNMMTRTAARALAEQDRIYMNSVDTGWITEENPEPIKLDKRLRRGFHPPLDVIDGAARLYDPIVRGVGGEPLYGHFLKDYQPAPW